MNGLSASSLTPGTETSLMDPDRVMTDFAASAPLTVLPISAAMLLRDRCPDIRARGG